MPEMSIEDNCNIWETYILDELIKYYVYKVFLHLDCNYNMISLKCIVIFIFNGVKVKQNLNKAKEDSGRITQS